MALPIIDRLLTIVVTATLTSAAWIVAGSVYFDREEADAAPAVERNSAPVADAQQMPPAAARETVAASIAGPLVIPVAGVTASQLTDTFFDARGGRVHEALDIMAPAGTAVIAA